MEPKIRITGFSGTWLETTIGEISSSFSGGTPSVGESKYYGGQIPFIRSGEINENKTQLFITEEGLNSSSARMVEKGTLLYAMYGATSGEVSISKINGAINQAILAIYPKKGYSSEYICHYLRAKKNDIVRELLQGGQGNLSGALIKGINICFPPSEDEQNAIAKYLDSLDTKIISITKKIESLKQVKAASLQSMFPQEGETTPRVRFKGFEGDWEKAIIRDICSFTKGQGYSKSDLKNEGCPIILYGRMYTSYSFEMNDIDTFAKHKEGAVYSKGNEVIIPASGETAEDIAIAAAVRQKGVILGGDLNILVFNDGYDPSFMALLISYSKTHYELSKYAQGKSVVHLRNNDIANGHVTCPSMEEQKQISSFFSKLDSQITLLSQRLEKLKQIKSACLENMFV